MNGAEVRQFILKAVRLRLPDGLCDASKKESLERDYMRRWGLNSTVKRGPPRGITTDQRRGVYIFSPPR
jgi:hypothetical protein